MALLFNALMSMHKVIFISFEFSIDQLKTHKNVVQIVAVLQNTLGNNLIVVRQALEFLSWFGWAQDWHAEYAL